MPSILRSGRTLALLSAVLLGGCGVRPTGLASTLPGSTWLVDRIVGADGSVRRGTGETVAFGADGRISLASCNLCGGAYTVSSSGVLSVGPGLACTRRGCPEGATELEREITGALRTSRDGEYLVLTAVEGGRQVILLPDAAVQPEAATQ